VTTTSEVGAAAVPIGVGFTPFEDRLDVIDRGPVHAEWRGLAFVSVAEAMGPGRTPRARAAGAENSAHGADDRCAVRLEPHARDARSDSSRTSAAVFGPHDP
jgi:hypothetical protein